MNIPALFRVLGALGVFLAAVLLVPLPLSITDGNQLILDADGDSSRSCVDCDDADGANRPGGTEVCDGGDNDCDGFVDDADRG